MLLLSVIICTFAVNVCADVPLLAWASKRLIDTEECSIINRVSPSIVEKLLMNFTKDEFKIIIFVEEFLAVEDFISRTSYGRGSFKDLEDICTRENCLFCPRVHGSLHSLNIISKKYSTMQYTLSEPININQCTHEILRNISNENSDVIIIHMEQTPELISRASLLQEHDKMMTEMCTCLGKHNKLLCIYTGLNGLQVKKTGIKDSVTTELYNERINRTKRNANYTDSLSSRIKELIIDDSSLKKLAHCEKNCLLSVSDKDSDVKVYVSAPPSFSYGKKTFDFTDFQPSLRQVNDSFINFKIRNEETSLRFNFAKRSAESWELTGVTANVDSKVIPLTSDVPVKARSGHSFVCQRTDFTGQRAKLSLFGMQIEPFFPRRKRQDAPGDEPQGRPPTRPPVDKPAGGAPAGDASAGDAPAGGAPAGGAPASPSAGGSKVTGFGKAEKCIPFQSIGVFMAYIVSGALILMLSWAVGMFQSVGINVNFDGPEQKVLLRD